MDSISSVANFSVKSQWLYLLPLNVAPKQVPDSSPLGRHYALSEEILPQVVTPLEKKLGKSLGNEQNVILIQEFQAWDNQTTFLYLSASQVSLHPCINLVIYVVPCENAPLHIYSKSGHKSSTANNVEAFISPRWGGVVIANPSIEQCIKETEDSPIDFVPEEATVMGVFISQLRLLLGVHELVRHKKFLI